MATTMALTIVHANMLKYKKTVGDADLYGSYLFEDSEYLPGNGLRYKRKGGGSLGIDYHLTTDLTWGRSAWNYTRAEMRNPDKRRQQILRPEHPWYRPELDPG